MTDESPNTKTRTRSATLRLSEMFESQVVAGLKKTNDSADHSPGHKKLYKATSVGPPVKPRRNVHRPRVNSDSVEYSPTVGDQEVLDHRPKPKPRPKPRPTSVGLQSSQFTEVEFEYQKDGSHSVDCKIPSRASVSDVTVKEKDLVGASAEREKKPSDYVPTVCEQDKTPHTRTPRTETYENWQIRNAAIMSNGAVNSENVIRVHGIPKHSQENSQVPLVHQIAPRSLKKTFDRESFSQAAKQAEIVPSNLEPNLKKTILYRELKEDFDQIIEHIRNEYAEKIEELTQRYERAVVAERENARNKTNILERAYSALENEKEATRDPSTRMARDLEVLRAENVALKNELNQMKANYKSLGLELQQTVFEKVQQRNEFLAKALELSKESAVYKKTTEELRQSKIAVEIRLQNVTRERDLLVQQNGELRATGWKDKVDNQLGATQEHIPALANTIVAKTEEVSELKEQIQKLEDELKVKRIQACQYEQDFKEERKAREQAVSARDDYSLYAVHVQTITEELKETKQAAEMERKTNKEVITELVVTIDQIQIDKNGLQSECERYKEEAQQLAMLLAKSESRMKLLTVEYKQELSQQLEHATRQVRGIQKQLDTRWKRFHSQVQKQPLQYDRKDLDAHKVTPRYPLQFNKKVGEGCYGSVYAIDLDGTPCIAKRLQDILMGRGREEPVSKEAKQRYHQAFFRECVLVSRMNHPNIVKFIGVQIGREEYDLTLILERLSTDLDKYIKRKANIPLVTKISILHGISCGLLFLHERSIIHRDLSAGNILLTEDNKAKIADLGVSKMIDRHQQFLELTNAPGAQAYMSPEALLDKPYDESLDIFSFGVVALYLAIQEFPEFSWVRVPDAIDQTGEGEIYKRRKWIDKMGVQQPELSPLVLWCLRDDPVSRPSTVCLNIIFSEMRDYK